MKEKKTEEVKSQQRKEYAQRGTRTQKMMSFRLDAENIEFLEQQVNKGRFINDLIAKARTQG